MGNGGPQRGSGGSVLLLFLYFCKILDSELFELMHQNGDYTHFYFCYRWFLLDFKRGKRCGWDGGAGLRAVGDPLPQSQWLLALPALQNHLGSWLEMPAPRPHLAPA